MKLGVWSKVGQFNLRGISICNSWGENLNQEFLSFSPKFETLLLGWRRRCWNNHARRTGRYSIRRLRLWLQTESVVSVVAIRSQSRRLRIGRRISTVRSPRWWTDGRSEQPVLDGRLPPSGLTFPGTNLVIELDSSSLMRWLLLASPPLVSLNISNGSIHLSINYSVSNETKWDE
jgi:hypothetical protein